MNLTLRRQAGRIVALALIIILYGFARLPQLAAAERDVLAAEFAFATAPLPALTQSLRMVRPVHPSVDRISAWMSSVGASVALNDLDGDGLPNDVCYVDVRTDQVILAPVPGTGARYEPFALTAAPLAYDAAVMAPMGCLPGDINEDGRMDLLVYFWGRTPVAFLHRDPARLPLTPDSYARQEIISAGGRWNSNAATFADLDGDGHLDLVIGNYFQDDDPVLDTGADGRVSMQHAMSRAMNAGTNRLLRWINATSGPNPTVQFEEAVGAFDEQVAHGWTLAVGAADLNGDLLPELYFGNDFGPDRLLLNVSQPGQFAFTLLEGEKKLTTPASKVLGRDSFKGMGVDFGDLNDDGLLDIYVSNIAAEYALEESHFVWLSTGELARMSEGVAPYVDRSESLGLSRSGWGWEARLGDFNNDGVLEAVQATGFVAGTTNRWPELQELALGNDELLRNPLHWPRVQPGDDLSGHQHNPFFVRAADGRYYDLAPALGLDTPQVTRGIATADVDGDGDLDFAIANQWATSLFYRNDCPDCGAFLGLRLLLPVAGADPDGITVYAGRADAGITGRPAIGAAVSVTLPDGRRLAAQVDGGNGDSGARSPELLFGLHDLPPDAAIQVDVRWRGVDGDVRQETLTLTPGWYTLMLEG